MTVRGSSEGKGCLLYTSSTGRLYVAKSGTPYILKISVTGSSGTGSLTFSNYNQPIAPVPPTGAIDLDTLAQAG